MVGIWGCTRGPSAATLAERIKSLEAKCNRIEADFHAASTARDQLRLQLSRSEDQVGKLMQVVKERDELKSQVAQRETERDQAVSQFDAFRNSLRDLLGHADSTALRFKGSDSPVVTISARPVIANPGQ
jgi:septal ring factor EnvC (AmiA/AmiB activator)